jgi:murein DD-endopeptidase MepM/ murein hydrolase activator NlpD
VSFPLAADAPFVDQDNWGASSAHWAQVHTGDDLSAACGTAVLAATDGTVLVRTDQTWSGRWLVLVSTGEGRLSTWYAHMESLRVADGASVRAGQQIGVVGAEGNATGCHLHFEVHPTGGSIYEDDTDPRQWLRAADVYPG